MPCPVAPAATPRLVERDRAVGPIGPVAFDHIPVGVMPGRQRLADARRPVAQADVLIAAAGVAELPEASVLLRLDESRPGRATRHRHPASASPAGARPPVTLPPPSSHRHPTAWRREGNRLPAFDR